MAEPAVKLSPQTWVPISVAVSAILMFAAGAVWINSNFQEVKFANRELANGLEEVKNTIKELRDRWTSRDMQQWVELLQAKNPTLSVPTIR
jgi:hypothetical protein